MKNESHTSYGSLVREGVMSAAAPFNFWQQVHASVNCKGQFFVHFFPANVQILPPLIEISYKDTVIPQLNMSYVNRVTLIGHNIPQKCCDALGKEF